MASVAELESMFNDLRTDLGAMVDERVKAVTEAKGKGKADIEKECRDIRQMWRFAQMGIFVLENVVVDLKRIADNAERANVEVVSTFDPDQLTIHKA